jgi:hypothetical protein
LGKEKEEGGRKKPNRGAGRRKRARRGLWWCVCERGGEGLRCVRDGAKWKEGGGRDWPMILASRNLGADGENTIEAEEKTDG